MFISFLYPFPIRNVEAPYLWVYYKQLTELDPQSVVFIGSKEYFFNPNYFLKKNRFELSKDNYVYNKYDIPNIEQINSYENFIIDSSVFSGLENKFGNSFDLIWKYLLTERYEPLERLLESILKQIIDKHNDIKAILSWCNCPSLQNIADKLGIKVIYNEVGALRPPFYNYMAYFDFSGVNGNTESEKRYKNFLEEINKKNINIPNFKLHELLDIISNKKQNIKSFSNKKTFKAGIALQVENDSNILAYSNGFNNFEIINLVKQYYNNDEILVRQHPSGFLDYSKLKCEMDTSASSADFIQKCNEIYSINSSVALEGFLFEKKVNILGESPFKFLMKLKKEDINLALTFILFGYMIPYELLFNKDYYNFRLSNKINELDIFLYHFKFYLEKNSSKYLSSNEQIDKIRRQCINMKEENNKIREENEKIKEESNRIKEENNRMKEKLDSINNSNGMKLLRKFYKIRDSFLPYGTRRRLLVKKLANKIYKNPRNFIEKKINQRAGIYTLGDFKIDKTKGIVILTTKHCDFIANLLKETLKKVNISAEIIYKMPFSGYKKLPHIVICPQMFDQLPEMYIAYQMEQSVTSRWFNENYFNKLKNSVAIFDYSLKNIDFLQKNNIDLKQIYYMPVSYVNNIFEENIKKEYDVLFYGDDSCLRRKNILSELSKEFNIKIINNLFGEELKKELKKAKIIINIHYYENALLETTRICECLSMNTGLIISENSGDIDEYKDIKNMIELVDVDNVEELKEKIRFYLNNELEYKKKIKKNKDLIISAKCKAFEYYLYRFLLATDNINFEEFYQLANNYIEFKENKWCLGLPEATIRHESFENDNTYGFEYFPGLRHSLGWIGCGLSYKFLLRKAKELNLSYVTICEDDVSFNSNFKIRLNNVIKYLEDNKEKWNIFSGLMADVSEETQVKSIDKFNDMEFIIVNKLISMVYNIYNNNAFECLEDWDSNNRDVVTNTIDRFIEKKIDLNIVIVLPFLVGCKNELESTLWGFKNIQYENMITASEEKIYNKISKFKYGE